MPHWLEKSINNWCLKTEFYLALLNYKGSKRSEKLQFYLSHMRNAVYISCSALNEGVIHIS